MVVAKRADGESAVLPSFDQVSPVLFLVGITGFALRHGWDLQDTGKENRVPKVPIDTRTGSAVR